MAGNQEVVVQMVSAEALRMFTNSCIVPRYLKRDFQKYWEGPVKIGSSMSIKRPIRSIGADGQAFQPEGIVRVTVPFSISYWNQESWVYNDTEEAMYLDDNWREMYLKPKILNLANKVDRYMMDYMTSTIPNYVGTPGQVPTTLQPYNDAQTKLDQLLAPKNDRCIIFNSGFNNRIVGAGQTLFNPQQIIGRQYLEGKVGRYANFDFMEDEQVPNYTLGTWTNPITVSAAGQTGANLTVTCPAGTLSLSPGPIGVDRITIAGVYEVNQYSRQQISGPTGGPVLKQFAVVQPVTDNAGAATLTLFPAMITSGQYQNCSGSPAAGAAVTVVGTSGFVGAQTAFALQEDAFTWAAIRLQKNLPGAVASTITDETTGISMRCVLQWDSRLAEMTMRVDFIWGITQLYADYDAAVIYG